MKKLLLCMVITIASMNASAVYLRYCSNPGTTYYPSFGFCINSNFRTADSELDAGPFLRSCNNSGYRGISLMMERCVNDNFQKIEQELENVFIRYCHNYSYDEVYFGFTSCVNQNFDAIERALL